MAANWNALMNAPNAGQAFMDAYGQARQRRQQEEMQREELTARREDRDLRRQILERQSQLGKVKEARDQLELMTRLLGSARDEGSYQSAKETARQAGFDVSTVPPVFDPAWVANKQREAQALSSRAGQAVSSLEREYEFLASKNPALADQFLQNKAQGSPIVQRNDDGTITVYPRSMLGSGDLGGSYDADNDDEWEYGGPTPPASGGFPR